MRQKLFSVTLKDCDVETFTVGGNGGSGKDTSNTGVRIRHRASGAVGIGRDSRSQSQNRSKAFTRMAKTPAFTVWVKKVAAELSTGKTLDEQVDESLSAQFLKIEQRDASGKWVVVE